MFEIKKIDNIKNLGFVSTQHIKENTIILVEKASEIIYNSHVCQNCAEPLKDSIKCNCDFAFCSLLCKDEHICTEDNFEDLIFKFAFQICKSGKDEDLIEKYCNNYNANTSFLLKYLKFIKIYPNIIIVFEILQTNAFTLLTPCLRVKYGIAMYELISKINHDCNPNCIYWTIKDTMYLKSIREIEAGEEITISYINSVSVCSKSIRDEILLNNFGITDCKCNRCFYRNDSHLDISDPIKKYELINKIKLLTFEKEIELISMYAKKNNILLLTCYSINIDKFYKQKKFEITLKLCENYEICLAEIDNYTEDILAYINFIKLVCIRELKKKNIDEYIMKAEKWSLKLFDSYLPLKYDFGI